uniref:Domain of unknown function DB domain-containing protein n=1 Tax=Romanomermis culicivorax TaxID=13658 RepID=A0A915J6Z2_ROMCU
MQISSVSLLLFSLAFVGAAPPPTPHDPDYQRIQECCFANGMRINGREECLAFCRFNTTALELENLGQSCVDHTAVWMYCAAEGQDNSACCRTKNVPELCMGFCRGDVTNLCRPQFYDSHYVCIQRISSILQCHKAALKQGESQWNVDDSKSKRPTIKKKC